MFPFDQTRPGTLRVVVMGCGGLGSAVTASLSERGHAVHVLDPDVSAFDALPQSRIEDGGIVTCAGDGTVGRDLINVSTPVADVFMALSGSDTKNALAAQLARQIYGVPRVVCRIDDSAMCEMYEELGLIAVSSTNLAAQGVARALGV